MSAIDDHFSAVQEVQYELEKFGAKKLVEACEIFKLLDNYSYRSDRVQFVTTHLLVRLGLRSNFGEEDIINDPDVSHAVSIPTNQNDNFIWDDTDSSSSSNFICDDTDSSSRSHVHNVTRDMNSIMDSSTGHAEALAACQFDVSFQVHVPESCSSWSSWSSFSSPLSSPSSVAGDASENESYIVLNTNVQGSNRKHNLGPNNSHAVSIPTNQNDNFICDVNKNYPNNNIEYQVPVQAEDKQEQLDSTFEDHPEPQPCSSKMNRKALKRNNVYPFTSRNTKVSKLESAFNKKCQMKDQQGKVSKSYLSVGTPSKECHVAEKVQLIDRAIKSTSSATDTKQPDIWKESSTSTSNASAEWNILYMTGITGGIEIASTANYNIQTKPIVVSDDFALKKDTSESSRPGWEVAKPGTSQADVPAGVPFLQEKTVPDKETADSKQKFFKCTVCGKTFGRRPSYRNHCRTHEKDRYSCATCHKTFYDKSNLNKHCRIHSGLRPFACDLCDKKFSDPTGLKLHKVRNH